MKTIPELVAEMTAATAAIQDAKERQRAVCAELVRDHAPYKKGEIAESRRGLKLSVTNVLVRDYVEYEAVWVIVGYKLKQDGTPGRLLDEFLVPCILNPQPPAPTDGPQA